MKIHINFKIYMLIKSKTIILKIISSNVTIIKNINNITILLL